MRFLKKFAFLALIIAFITTALALQNPKSVNAQELTCSATASKTVVSPGETFTLTVDFSDDTPHRFRYDFLSTNLFESVNPSSDPTTVTVTAPDVYFSGIEVSPQQAPRFQPDRFSCIATVSSSEPPSESFCTYDFNPKTVEFGGTDVTATVNNTREGFIYRVAVGGTQSDWVESESNNSTITIRFDSPQSSGQYSVSIDSRGPGGRGTQRCTVNPALLTVEKDSQGEGEPGKNPCEGGICETALGNISTNPKEFATRILQIATSIGGGIALILMVIGSVRVLTSSGDQQKLNGGRDMIVAAVAGLLFIIFSVLILRFIGLEILKI